MMKSNVILPEFAFACTHTFLSACLPASLPASLSLSLSLSLSVDSNKTNFVLSFVLLQSAANKVIIENVAISLYVAFKRREIVIN